MMFTQLRMKLASRRVERAKNRAARAKSNKSPRRIRDMIMRTLGAVWAWLRCIDLIAMVNLTLLVAIIVLFSMLIIDITRPTPTTIVVANPTTMDNAIAAHPQITVTDASAPRRVRACNRGKVIKAVVPESPVTVVRTAPEIAPTPVTYDLYGDIIVDACTAEQKLTPGIRISGNVYLQNMRRYTLPCGTYIDGNLFLRDVAQLRFCGDFVVTGNIYINRNSSFGPIPRTARLGGQVIM